MQITTHNSAETESFAETFALKLTTGCVVALRGPVGAGKTVFAKGFAKGLGVKEEITSPTFTVVNEYRSGRMPLFHFDMYRLTSPEELFDIGWEEYLAEGGVCLVEWSENISEMLGQGTVTVEIQPGEKEDERIITAPFG